MSSCLRGCVNLRQECSCGADVVDDAAPIAPVTEKRPVAHNTIGKPIRCYILFIRLERDYSFVQCSVATRTRSRRSSQAPSQVHPVSERAAAAACTNHS